MSFDVRAPLPSGTTILQASAGTGKSWSTAALAIRYLADGLADVSSLMIVTFSRVATQHLSALIRQRLATVLAALDAPATTGEDVLVAALRDATPAALVARRERLADALTDIDRATVMTTHEFCQGMLRGLGVLALAEAPPHFAEDLTGLVSEVAQDVYLRQFADSEDAPLLPWSTADDPHYAENLAVDGLRHPDAMLAPDDAGPGGRERVAFVREVRREFERRKHSLGAYTFDDMLTRLRDSLADPEVGAAACARLRERFRVVLVDEFQDTDPIQWEILHRAFDGHSTLVLVGDPNQAIYGFRGADVNAYAAAVRSAAQQTRTLTTNYRSDADVVAAVGALFDGVSLGPGIAAAGVTAARRQRRLLTDSQDPWHPAVRIRAHLTDPPLPADSARRIVDSDLVAQVVALLDGGARLAGPSGPRPVQPEDIAVLVRTNKRGRQITRALAAAGVAATFTGAESIFASEAAGHWLTLLEALTSHRTALLRAAMRTPFIGLDLPDLLDPDDTAVAGAATILRGWARVLGHDGVAALFATVSASPGVAARIMASPRGERLLTDYRHLAEILNDTATRANLGPAELTGWLTEAISTAGRDGQRVRRLETDARTVHVMTIHRSKGLEFPVVLLPDVADRNVDADDEGRTLTLHEGDHRIVDVGGLGTPGRSARFKAAVREDADDSLRGLYVAMTRGQSQVTTWWVSTKSNTAASPLHRLLFAERTPGGTTVPALRYPTDPAAPLPDPSRLTWLAQAGVAVQSFGAAAATPASRRVIPAPALSVRPWTRDIDHTWRRTSYSALTSAVHDGRPELFVADEPDATTAEVAVPLLSAPSPLAEMPAGTAFGSFVHAVLERYQGEADPAEELERLSGPLLRRFGLSTLAPRDIAQALVPTVTTSLGRLTGGASLRQLPDRLRELDFEMPLGAGEASATVDDIAELLAATLAREDPLAAYPSRLREVGNAALRGFLTGSIDAVLRVPASPERYVVVDYKTNRLGTEPSSLGHYTRDAMAEAMMASHYPLQALLYEVALHRFLSRRLRGYRPEAHLGGVLYLFVRGLGGDPATGTGVFEWEPPEGLVPALSRLLAGGRP